MILTEQGADFFSKEIGGAEDEESGERPREGLRERDFSDEDVEFAAIHASGIGRFSNDADFVVARAEGRDADLPARIGKLLDFGGVEGSPHGLVGLWREVLRGGQGAVKRVFVEEAFSLLQFALDDKFDGFGPVVAPGHDGSGGTASWKKSGPMEFRLEAVGEIPRHALAERLLLLIGEDFWRRGRWRGARSGRRGWRCAEFNGRRLDIGFPCKLHRWQALGLGGELSLRHAWLFGKFPFGLDDDMPTRENIEGVLLSGSEVEAIAFRPDDRSGGSAAGILKFCSERNRASWGNDAQLVFSIDLPLEA